MAKIKAAEKINDEKERIYSMWVIAKLMSRLSITEAVGERIKKDKDEKENRSRFVPRKNRN